MEGMDQTGTGMQRCSYAFGASSSSVTKLQNPPNFNSSQMGPSQIMGGRSTSQHSQNFNLGPSHYRSLSQPSYFVPHTLAPLPPSLYSENYSASIEENVINSHAPSVPLHVSEGPSFQAGDSFPPRKGHRHSSSEIPLKFSAMLKPSPQLIPVGAWESLEKSVSGGGNSGHEKPTQLVMKGSSNHAEEMGEKKSEYKVVGDVLSEYMNLDNIAELNSSGVEFKGFDSNCSGSKTNEAGNSNNEVASHIKGKLPLLQSSSIYPSEKREGVTGSANGDSVPDAERSLSRDCSIESLHFEDESQKLPHLGNQASQHLLSNSMNGKTSNFVMEIGNDEFNEEELKKIAESDKLAQIALSDPKRAKRILANRQSAARSKERKTRYIVELEQTMQTLLTETTTLSTQLEDSERNNLGLKTENKELKFRLQAMDIQSHLKDAISETLTAEVRHLRRILEEFGGAALLSSCMARQIAINQQITKLQQPNRLEIAQFEHHLPRQTAQLESHQLQQPESQSHQHDDQAMDHVPNQFFGK
ncbi:Transcription factor like [Quillaja saponaria]|uniref:Transcription factor like n=1 Tax=Quillaja saponaria TaxID=32244 RepID=A0AAD7M163_QUISA|nr:Transcription factor like [Quillaja saponaria]